MPYICQCHIFVDLCLVLIWSTNLRTFPQPPAPPFLLQLLLCLRPELVDSRFIRSDKLMNEIGWVLFKLIFQFIFDQYLTYTSHKSFFHLIFHMKCTVTSIVRAPPHELFRESRIILSVLRIDHHQEICRHIYTFHFFTF